ncbi:MAG: hypothetical protein PHR64_01490 [Candidatus Shapirobacteria bacterium]|nr:hypothetical protein [Candidatus Shapirobacteria bacterium]MDD5073982.1 hypothetical protein [Candidatus Shapirobacteria bacterium]MDD5481605.1 hypothetical protein [Candidatus Shapirobacteria bacterium]
MVKKTRKEKQAADLRKKDYSVLPKNLPEQSNAFSLDNASWIKKDLIKSFALAFIVLIFQLVLYWQLK